MQFFDLVIIGGGAAGISAAIQAKESGINNILILEKEHELGGTLNQCIHSGYGIDVFNENLTGTEFAQRLIDNAAKLKIQYKLNTTVVELNKDKTLTAVNSEDGVFQINWKALILAAGCVENTRDAINITGNKFAGIYTAGEVQRLINIEGYLPGRESVIIGSDNIGLIMARRMVLEGARVKAVVEKSSFPKGSRKNVEECLEYFNIPLLLNYEVINVKGNARIEGITVAMTDNEERLVEGTEKELTCDAVIISVELVPKDDLLKNAGIKVMVNGFTDTEGVFVCGDSNFVHDNADSIVMDGRSAGNAARKYISEITGF